MKLVTFQSLDAIKDLFKKGYLECNKSKIDIEKLGITYKWIVENMNLSVDNKYNTSYPIWCWVKCYNNIYPPKRKGEKMKNNKKITTNNVGIIFSIIGIISSIVVIIVNIIKKESIGVGLGLILFCLLSLLTNIKNSKNNKK